MFIYERLYIYIYVYKECVIKMKYISIAICQNDAIILIKKNFIGLSSSDPTAYEKKFCFILFIYRFKIECISVFFLKEAFALTLDL